MFFRRRPPKETSFRERLDSLRNSGFTVTAHGVAGVLVCRGNCAAEIEDVPNGPPRVRKAGLLIGGEIAMLVDGGYQKFLRTPAGDRVPALAADLVALHGFEEDLREKLGLVSLYNESLGTTCDYHVYDRLEGRD